MMDDVESVLQRLVQDMKIEGGVIGGGGRRRTMTATKMSWEMYWRTAYGRRERRK